MNFHPFPLLSGFTTTYPRLLRSNTAFELSFRLPLYTDDTFLLNTSGVILSSLVLKTPMPAGFILAAEKSAPSAPNAPPTAIVLAVP